MRPYAAIVTGAGRGIGRATARALARAGHSVVLAARTVKEVQAAADDIRAEGLEAEAVGADIALESEVAKVFHRAHERFGPVTLLVNNAGTLTRTAFPELTLEDFDRTLAVNLRGAFLCARAAFRDMMAAGGGCIINIASLSGVAGVEKFPGLAAYVVSKSGIVGLTEALAVEGRPFNIRAVALSPGAVDTGLLRVAAPQVRPGMSPDEAAGLVVFVAGDASAALNGLNIPIFSNV